MNSLIDPLSKQLNLILFIDKTKPETQNAVEMFAALNVSEAYVKQVLNISENEETVNYFGILETPAVAIITQGSLLGLVGDCSAESCKWVVQSAEATLKALNLATV